MKIYILQRLLAVRLFQTSPDILESFSVRPGGITAHPRSGRCGFRRPAWAAIRKPLVALGLAGILLLAAHPADAAAQQDKEETPGTAGVWLQAAKAGDCRAQFEIASLYLSGQWGAQDEAQGIYWLQRSAGQGFAPAFLLLTHIYSQGTGLRPPDPARASLWAARLVNGRRLPHDVDAAAPMTAEYGNGARVRLSEEEIQLLHILQSDFALEKQGAGITNGTPMPDAGETLTQRRLLARKLNSGLTRQSRWVVDPHSACLVWFQELQGDEFIRWDGACDAEGFATGRGTLSFRSQHNGQITRCSGIMNAGIIVEGEFREGE